MAQRRQINPNKRKKDTAIERPEKTRQYQYCFLIVCEDERTEKVYFEQFKEAFPPNVFYLEVHGTGFDQPGVVRKAITEAGNMYNHFLRTPDKIWVVFDVDDAASIPGKGKNFTEALELAANAGIEVAYSNEVFELWLLLHFRDVDESTAIPRQAIYDQFEPVIRSYTGYEDFTYEHGKTNIINVVAEIGNEQEAIKRAEHLEQAQKGKAPLEANPVTYVHKLVTEIRSWVAFFSWGG